MDVRVVYLTNDGEVKKGEIRIVPQEVAGQLTRIGKACYYSDFTQKMLEDLEEESLESSSPKKKALKKD